MPWPVNGWGRRMVGYGDQAAIVLWKNHMEAVGCVFVLPRILYGRFVGQ